MGLYGWGILSELAAQEVYGPHHHEEKSKVFLEKRTQSIFNSLSLSAQYFFTFKYNF